MPKQPLSSLLPNKLLPFGIEPVPPCAPSSPRSYLLPQLHSTIYQGSCRKLVPTTLEINPTSSSSSSPPTPLEKDGYITKTARNGVKYFDETYFVASNDAVNSTLAMISWGTLDGQKRRRVLWVVRSDNFRNPHTNSLPVLSARKLDTLEFSDSGDNPVGFKKVRGQRNPTLWGRLSSYTSKPD